MTSSEVDEVPRRTKEEGRKPDSPQLPQVTQQPLALVCEAGKKVSLEPTLNTTATLQRTKLQMNLGHQENLFAQGEAEKLHLVIGRSQHVLAYRFCGTTSDPLWSPTELSCMFFRS